MSDDHSSPKPLPAMLGGCLSVICAGALLGGLGLFGFKLIEGVFTPPLSAEVTPDAPAPPSTPATPATKPVESSPEVAETPTSTPAPEASPSNLTPEFIALGKTSYATCAACHGLDGKGMPGVNMAPVFAGSEVATGNTIRPIATILNGANLDMTRHVGQMIPWKTTMNDEAIAAVLTHIRSNFGNSAPPITPEMVAKVRAEHGDHAPYSGAELEALTDVIE